MSTRNKSSVSKNQARDQRSASRARSAVKRSHTGRSLRARRELEEEEETPAPAGRAMELMDEVFDTLLQLRRLEEGELPPAESIRKHLAALVRDLPDRAAELGYSRDDGADIQYALIAFADEVASNLAESIRDYWQENLLQMEFFDENTAGEGFFDRLEKVRRHRDRPDVLLGYYFCLILGFKGKYRVRGADAELLELVDSLRASLDRAGLKEPDALSPHAERSEEAAKDERRQLYVMLIPVVAVAATLVAYLLFGRSQPEIDATIAAIDAIIRGG